MKARMNKAGAVAINSFILVEIGRLQHEIEDEMLQLEQQKASTITVRRRGSCEPYNALV